MKRHQDNVLFADDFADTPGFPRKKRLIDYFRDLNIDSEPIEIRYGSNKNREYIGSIDDYLNDGESSADEVELKGGPSNKKLYISKRYIDPLAILGKSDSKKLQTARKDYRDKIIAERVSNNKRGLSNDFDPESDTDSDLYDSFEDEDLMEIDGGAGFKRHKLKRDENEVSDAEIYHRMYLDRNFSLVKYQDYKQVVFENWKQWLQKWYALHVEYLDDGNSSGKVDVDGDLEFDDDCANLDYTVEEAGPNSTETRPQTTYGDHYEVVYDNDDDDLMLIDE